MAQIKFEVHVLEKSGATTTFEADTREAAEDMAARMKTDDVKVAIVERGPLEGLVAGEVPPQII